MPFTWFSKSFEFFVNKAPPNFIVSCKIGYDPDLAKTYFVEAALVPTGRVVASDGGQAWELSFYVLEVDAVSSGTTPYFSGLDTKHIFLKQDRPGVMAVFGTCVGKILEEFAPDSVFRITYDNSPPEKALQKHQFISSFFEAKGYEVTKWESEECWVFWAVRIKKPETGS